MTEPWSGFPSIAAFPDAHTLPSTSSTPRNASWVCCSLQAKWEPVLFLTIPKGQGVVGEWGSQSLFIYDFILSWTDGSAFVTGLHNLGVFWGFSERSGLRERRGWGKCSLGCSISLEWWIKHTPVWAYGGGGGFSQGRRLSRRGPGFLIQNYWVSRSRFSSVQEQISGHISL